MREMRGSGREGEVGDTRKLSHPLRKCREGKIPDLSQADTSYY